MADWNLPATTTTYVNVLANLKDRDLDIAKLFDGVTVTNPATGMIRWSSANARLEKWSGAAWVALLLARSWAHRTGHDLLDIALPVLVAAHIADFMLSRRGTEDAAVGMRAVAGALLRPANWLWAGAFYLWLAWVGL